MDFNYWALALATLIIAISPGPGFFATVARALASGFAQWFMLIGGILLGIVVFLLIALYGLSAISVHLQGFFLLVKYLGAIYLLVLGIALWRSQGATID